MRPERGDRGEEEGRQRGDRGETEGRQRGGGGRSIVATRRRTNQWQRQKAAKEKRHRGRRSLSVLRCKETKLFLHQTAIKRRFFRKHVSEINKLRIRFYFICMF